MMALPRTGSGPPVPRHRLVSSALRRHRRALIVPAAEGLIAAILALVAATTPGRQQAGGSFAGSGPVAGPVGSANAPRTATTGGLRQAGFRADAARVAPPGAEGRPRTAEKMGVVRSLSAILLVLTLAGCGASADTTGTARPSPSATQAHGTVRHVVWILMENRPPGVLDSPGAPYLARLARTYGYATDYRAIAHPSLPNYIALTSGGTQGVKRDWDPSSTLPPKPETYALDVPSIFGQLRGGRSRSLLESMPTNCGRINRFPYLARHNPEAYYTNLGSDCSHYDVPFGPAPDLRAAFTLIVPNAIDDMHNGTIQDGNRFLAAYVPQLMGTPQYRSGHTVIFITWDESESDTGVNRVPLIVISPYTHGVVDRRAYSHYTLLRTTEQLLGLPPLDNARTAPSMVGRFGF